MSVKGKILIRPLVTEKMTAQTERMLSHRDPRGRYGFIVSLDANRLEIAQAVESRYNVTVESVNTMRYLGKSRMRYVRGGRLMGRTSSYKKAIVTLKRGDQIDFFSNI